MQALDTHTYKNKNIFKTGKQANETFRNPSNSPNNCLRAGEEKGIQVCRGLSKDEGVRGMRGAGGRGKGIPSLENTGISGVKLGKNSAYLGP